MGEKLTAQPEKITGFADDDLIHTVAGGESWKVKYINLIKFFWSKISGRDIVNSGNGYITINDYTSLDIFSSEPTNFTTTLSADTSANHLIILSSGGPDFVTVTINSYPSPKDGAIVQLRLSEKGTTDLIICGINWPGSAFAAGLYTIRYSGDAGAWLPINFIPFGIVSASELAAYQLISNKATNFSTVNNTLYPSVQAVVDYVTAFPVAPVSTDDVTNASLYAGATQTDVNNVAKSIIYGGGSNPGVSQDSSQGYSVGSLFVNQSSGVTFRAEDVSAGAAVWAVKSDKFTSQNSIFVSSVNTGNAAADAISNGVLLRAAITAANALVVGTRAINNRVAVVLTGGTYDADGVGFTIPSFMDIVGLSSSAGDTILTNTTGDYTLIAGENVDYGLYNIDLRPGALAALNDDTSIGQFHRWNNVLISGLVTTGMSTLFGDFRRIRATNDVEWAVVSGSIGGYHEIEFDATVTQVYNSANGDLGGVINFKGQNFGNFCFFGSDFSAHVNGTAGNFGNLCFATIDGNFSGSANLKAGNYGNDCFFAGNDFSGPVKGTFGNFGNGCFSCGPGNFSGPVKGTFGNFGDNCFVSNGADFTPSLEITTGAFGVDCMFAIGIFAPTIINSNIEEITSGLTGSLINSTVRSKAVGVGDLAKIERCKILGSNGTNSIIGTTTSAQILDTNSSMPIAAGVTGVLNGNYNNASLT